MGYPVEPISTARERECRDRHRTIDREEREGGDRDRKRMKTKTDRQTDRRKEREREREGWMDGLLYNQWIDHNNIVGER